MGDVVAEADLADPNPDVQDLFQHYDRLYFRGALADAGFIVKWGSLQSSSSFGSCTFSKPSNTITLSEPVLKYLSCTDRKNALLHEMIHAIIYVKRHRKDSCHGPLFRAWMDAINSCSIKDHQRPDGGYNITTRHDFRPEKPHSFKGILWKCESCGDTLLRATNQGPPSDACCIENVNSGGGASCGNMLCHWHNHKNDCCGTYEKTELESDALSQKRVPGGAQLLLTYPLEMSKSKGAIQESSSSALQGNTKATKPNAEDKHLPLVSGSNGKSQGSSSSKKASKRRRPEVVLETSVLLAESPRKSKGKKHLVAAEDGLLSLVGCSAPKSTRSSKKVVKADMWHKHDDVQKSSGLPASLEGKPNQKKVGKGHKPDDDQKPSGLPSTPLGTPKLKHTLIKTEKDKLSSAEDCNDAKSPRSTLRKTGEQHKLQIAQKASAPGCKAKASGVAAPEKQRKGKCKGKPVKEKEYAVMSAWLDYYESDRSSGSIEPLVNKRTERRRRGRERERARILIYSRSKKTNPAPLISSRTDASVSSHRIKMLPHKDESMQQSRPPPPCSDAGVLTTASQTPVVVTQATGDHSQPSAPCLDIVPLQPTDPPSSPSDQSTAPDIIDISDDD
ncbi:hypothetical protein C2845_PMPSC040775 [Panicum miliaceum]|uniref:SprT-like domain-containing protein n=1 Tax=Panicum miliaceum TaxID=4540 RepID=A0A3L6PBD0_PANMI|nr:hypothetical protein C2845_PMPSC040775 [Panicum miliaceum]